MMRSLAVTFFTVSASALWLQASPIQSETRDRLNPASFGCRNEQRLLASPQDVPDGITAVDVSDEGNADDPDTGLGMVIQEYSIGQTEVTARQYCYYLNQVAAGDNYQLFYNEKMGSDKNVASIKRNVIDGKNVYTVIQDAHGDRGDFPIVYVSLYQAARFCNWLQNRNTPGLVGIAVTETGAYTLDSKSSGRIARNPGAVWFIPTESEWYKPAYYKGGSADAGYWHFANRSDWAPSNSLQAKQNGANYSSTMQASPYLTTVHHFEESTGAYNTFDMSGNVAEWIATEENQGTLPLRYVARGGSWKSSYYGNSLGGWCDAADWGMELSKWSRPAYDPTQGYDNIGFRVATSLLVNGAVPNTPAPGESELSPTEALEAPLFVLTGLAAIFSTKKIIACHQDAEQKRRVTEPRVQKQRPGEIPDYSDDDWQSVSTVPRGDLSQHPLTQGEEESESEFHSVSSSVPSSSKRRKGALTPSPKKALAKSPGQQRAMQAREEVESAIKNIASYFQEAVGEYTKYKDWGRQKGSVTEESFQKIEAMCAAYDNYANQVVQTAAMVKERFPEASALWIPWHTVAMNALIEAMSLQHYAVKPHYLGQFSTEKKAVLLREADGKTTESVLAFVSSYEEVLESLQKQNGTRGQQEAGCNPLSDQHSQAQQKVDETIQIIQVEKQFLEQIQKDHTFEQANKHKFNSGVNGSHLDYTAQFTGSKNPYGYRSRLGIPIGSNRTAISCLDQQFLDQQRGKITNLVDAAELQQQFQAFLEAQKKEEISGTPPSSSFKKGPAQSPVPSTPDHGTPSIHDVYESSLEGDQTIVRLGINRPLNRKFERESEGYREVCYIM